MLRLWSCEVVGRGGWRVRVGAATTTTNLDRKSWKTEALRNLFYKSIADVWEISSSCVHFPPPSATAGYSWTQFDRERLDRIRGAGGIRNREVSTYSDDTKDILAVGDEVGVCRRWNGEKVRSQDLQVVDWKCPDCVSATIMRPEAETGHLITSPSNRLACSTSWKICSRKNINLLLKHSLPPDTVVMMTLH